MADRSRGLGLSLSGQEAYVQCASVTEEVFHIRRQAIIT